MLRLAEAQEIPQRELVHFDAFATSIVTLSKARRTGNG